MSQGRAIEAQLEAPATTGAFFLKTRGSLIELKAMLRPRGGILFKGNAEENHETVS